MKLEKQIDPFSQENDDKNPSVVLGSSVNPKDVVADDSGSAGSLEVPEEEDMSETT